MKNSTVPSQAFFLGKLARKILPLVATLAGVSASLAESSSIIYTQGGQSAGQQTVNPMEGAGGSFITPNTGSFAFRSVTISLGSANIGTGNLAVSLWDNSFSTNYALSGPAIIPGNGDYTYTSGTPITLTPGAGYWVALSTSASSYYPTVGWNYVSNVTPEIGSTDGIYTSFSSIKRFDTEKSFQMTVTADPISVPNSAYWLGQSDGIWTGTSNWATDVSGTATSSIPGSATDVTFSATGAQNQDTTLGADFEIHSLTVNDPMEVTIGGKSSLTVSGTDGTTGITVNEGAGKLTISSDLLLFGAGKVITVNNLDGMLLAGQVSGDGLTKTGTGSLTFAGKGKFKGDLFVDQGSLTLTGFAFFDQTYLGSSGSNASLFISNGGELLNSTASIGGDGATDHHAVVTGTDSRWTVKGALNVGFQGTSNSLAIGSGGLVEAGSTIIGGANTAQYNTLSVSGAGSALNNFSDLIVGYDGSNNSLSISGGATATNKNAFLGEFADSSFNSAYIYDPGSLWTINGTFYLGADGSDNQVQISNGGQVSVTGTDTVIGNDGSANNNSLWVTGTGSKIDNALTLYVGKGGSNNSLYVDGGGQVEDKNGRVGANVGSDGNYVSISGMDSLWKNNGTLRVGDKGSFNSVDITDGAHVTVGANMFVGYSASAIGNSVNVDGTNSLLDVTGTLTVSLSGTSNSVRVSNGGVIHAPGIVLSGSAGSSSELIIGGFVKKPTLQVKARPSFDSLPGTIDSPTIFGGAGDSQVIFAHSGTAYTFDPIMSGALGVSHEGTGQTIITGANSYTGGTVISSGTLTTFNVSALGTGDVSLGDNRKRLIPNFTPPTLKAIGALTINSLDWGSGSLELDPNVAPINITNAFTNHGGSNFVASNTLTLGQTYTLVNFGSTDYTASDFTLSYHNPNVTYLAQFAVTGTEQNFGPQDGGQVLLTILGAYATGSGLQNSNPVGLPTFASFFVNGLVNTGSPTENNTINALTFAPGSLLNVFNQLAVTDGNFTVDSGTGTIGGTGTVTTPGDFNKLGAGLLNLLADVLVHGNTNILNGLLAVNGTLTTDNLYVQLTTFLKGSGIVFGNVINNGTVAPGNSPGTLTITGNYTQTSSGALDIEIASTSLFDQLIVSGNASLAGALNVISYDGFKFQYGQKFKFLQAGSISGSFDSINMPGNFRGRILEKNDALTLLVAPKSYVTVAVTQNQKNVAKALNKYISATKRDRQKVSIALDKQSASQYPASFDQIAPNFYESLANTTIELANGQNQILAQRMSAVRLGARGFTAIGMQAVLANDKDGKGVMDAKSSKDILKPSFDTKWGVWVEGNGIFARVTNISDVPNYRYQSGGFTVGADYAWNEHLSTGLYTGYQGTYAKYSNGGVNTINSALFGVYATYAQDGFYSDAIIGGSYNGYTARRPIQFSSINRTATSTPNGGQFTTYLDAGYDWHVNKFTFGPVVAGQYTYVGIAPFTEQGAKSLDLRVNQQNADSLRTNIGGRVAYTWNAAPNITLIPEARIFWQHEFLENSRSIGASLDGGNGPSFNYQTANPGRDSVLATAGVSAQFGQRWNGNFYYTADFGNQSFVSHMINAGVEWKF